MVCVCVCVCVCEGGWGGVEWGSPHRWRNLPFDRLVNRLNMCAKILSCISVTGPLEGSLRLQARKGTQFGLADNTSIKSTFRYYWLLSTFLFTL